MMNNKPRCATPGTIWGTEILARKIVLTINLPAEILKGLNDERREHLSRSLHNAILPVIEGVFIEQWPLLAGKTIDASKMPASWSLLFKD